MDAKDYKLVYVYDHQKDEIWREELSKHIPGWHEGEVQPGTDRLEEVKKHMESADIILLLLSADFFETCDGLWRLALELHETRKTHIVPILLRSYFLPKEFAGLQALPRNRKPITMWDRDHRDEAYKDIAREINKIITQASKKPTEVLSSQLSTVVSRREWITRSAIAIAGGTLGVYGTLLWTKPKRLESVKMIIVHKSVPSGFTVAPLQTALQEVLGLPVTLEVGKSYSDAVERFASREFNVLWGTDYAYVIARKKCGARVILRRKNQTTESLTYYSHILTRRSKHITHIEDLRGKSFTFVDLYSTSGYLYPLYAMYKKGLTERDLNPPELAGDHEASLQAIISGSRDAGAVSSEFYKSKDETLSETYKETLAQYNLTDSDIVSIYRSSALSSSPIAVQADGSDDDIRKLQSAFFLLEDNAALLGALGISGFSHATDVMYNPVRDTARELKQMGAERIEDV